MPKVRTDSSVKSVTEKPTPNTGRPEPYTCAYVLDGVLPGVGVPEGLVERIVATVVPER
ncbi:hypothetical protein EDD92_6192 [Streptomyces sp. TLI_185]|nr:hypothetical protein EDD92_6192 [Streptomyces sp. TLI_185]